MIALALIGLLWSSPARASGLPELDGDVSAFLHPVGLQAPPTPNGAAEADPWIEKARGYYRRLRSEGHLAADADFVSVDDADHDRSPGSAEFDFARGRCTVYLNERLMKVSGFDKPFLFQFMIYHELQHCHLYANPRQIKPFPSLSGTAALMISDLVHLEFFQPGDDNETPRANGYGVYHETYADIKAMGVLLAEGASRDRLDQILRFRRGGSMMAEDPHDTAGGLEKVGSIDWTGLDPAGVDAQARALADEAIGETFIRRLISPDPVMAKATDHLAGRLQLPLNDLAAAGDGTRASIRKQLAQAERSSEPSWQEYARLVREGVGPDGIAERFFQDRYGAGAAGLAAANDEIRRAVAR